MRLHRFPLRIGLAAILLPAATPAFSAEGFDLSGSVRLRMESISGQVRPLLERDETILAMRTIVRASYEKGPVEFAAELRDSRVYGNSLTSATGPNDVNAMELVVAQVRVDFDDLLAEGSNLSIAAGRVALGLGNFRLIDSPDFRNTTNGYTGIAANLDLAQGQRVQAFWAMPQQRLPSDREAVRANRVEFDHEGLDQQVWGIDGFTGKALGRMGVGFTYVGIYERDRPDRQTRDRRLHTLGPRLLIPPAPGRFDLDTEALLQWGEVSQSLLPGAATLHASAWFARAEVGYSFESPLRPRLSVRYDIASGDRPGGDFTRFDRLFGNRVSEFGPSGIYAATARANINSPGVRVSIAPGTRFTAYTSFRALWAESGTDSFSTTNVRDPSGRSGRFAGWQLEGRAQHWIVPGRLRAELAYAVLFREGLLVNAPNAPEGRTTAYLAPAIFAPF